MYVIGPCIQGITLKAFSPPFCKQVTMQVLTLLIFFMSKVYLMHSSGMYFFDLFGL